MKKDFAGLTLAFACLLAGCNVSISTDGGAALPEPTAGTATQQQEARAAADRLLDLIDRKRFDDTWTEAGPALRNSSNRFLWTNTLKMATSTFGRPATRHLDGLAFSTQVDHGAPVGEYAIIQFSDRVGSVTTTEKLVMQREAGRWKIVGYFLHKQAQTGGAS